MFPRPKLLIIDDEKSITNSLNLLLSDTYEVSLAGSGEQGLETFQKITPDIVLLDLFLPEIDGIETLKIIKKNNPLIPVVMLSGANTVKTAVEAIKCGAVDYLNKPFKIEDLKLLLSNLVKECREINQKIANVVNNEIRNTPLENYLTVNNPESNKIQLIGQSITITEIKAKITQIAKSDTTVLITGESGTGKEVVAKLIHQESKRSHQPFVAINCGAIPETLIESELFGHEKGSFTHAVEKRIGHFELADNGTLFLDEIGELSLNVQVKLLRFLQEQEFYRIGRGKPIKVNVRVLAATNKKLEDLIQEKKFREDLYYRINVLKFNLPPLRERKEDIPYLINFFIEKLSPRYDNRILRFEKSALSVLQEYNWNGNIRELENMVESLFALSEDDVITFEEIPEAYRYNNINQDKNIEQKTLVSSFLASDSLTREKIENALILTNYNQSRTANLLGVTRRVLKYRMDKLGLKGK